MLNGKPEWDYNALKQYYLSVVPDIPEDTWIQALSLFTTRFVKKGGYVLNTGQVCKTVSFLQQGLIRGSMRIDGKEYVLVFFMENDYLSEYASFLTQTPASYSLIAMEDCYLIELDYQAVQSLYRLHHTLERFGRRIAEQLFVLISMRNSALLTMSPEERYRTMLANGNSSLWQRAPQYLIASYLGITPEALSRIRRRMASSIS